MMDFERTFCCKCMHRSGVDCLKFHMTIYRAWRHINGCKIMGGRLSR
jgi:hypothetical protein